MVGYDQFLVLLLVNNISEGKLESSPADSVHESLVEIAFLLDDRDRYRVFNITTIMLGQLPVDCEDGEPTLRPRAK